MGEGAGRGRLPCHPLSRRRSPKPALPLSPSPGAERPPARWRQRVPAAPLGSSPARGPGCTVARLSQQVQRRPVSRVPGAAGWHCPWADFPRQDRVGSCDQILGLIQVPWEEAQAVPPMWLDKASGWVSGTTGEGPELKGCLHPSLGSESLSLGRPRRAAQSCGPSAPALLVGAGTALPPASGRQAVTGAPHPLLLPAGRPGQGLRQAPQSHAPSPGN